MTLRIAVSTASLLVLTAVPALACPVCGAGGNEENGAVYLAMSVVLSGLPLAMIGGIVFWLRRAARRDDSDQRVAARFSRPSRDFL